jgi:nitroreductase
MPETIDLEQKKHALADAPVEDIILRRWSPRAFANKPVSDADLKVIFAAASWAASSFNEQPWRFLVGRKGDETWNKIFQALMPFNQSWAGSAPVLYASFAKHTFSHNGLPNRVAMHDVGAASATLALQATALGLHTHGMAGFDGEALRAAFGIPDDFEPVAVWALGYLGDPGGLPEKYREMEFQPRTRKPLREFVFSEWEQAAKF